jgi:hypothetical protein
MDQNDNRNMNLAEVCNSNISEDPLILRGVKAREHMIYSQSNLAYVFRLV